MQPLIIPSLGGFFFMVADVSVFKEVLPSYACMCGRAVCIGKGTRFLLHVLWAPEPSNPTCYLAHQGSGI